MNCDCVARQAIVKRHPSDDMTFKNVVDILNILVLENKELRKRIEVLENARQKQQG